MYIHLCLCFFFADKWLKMAFVCLNGENCHRPKAIIEDLSRNLTFSKRYMVIFIDKLEISLNLQTKKIILLTDMTDVKIE